MQWWMGGWCARGMRVGGICRRPASTMGAPPTSANVAIVTVVRRVKARRKVCRVGGGGGEEVAALAAQRTGDVTTSVQPILIEVRRPAAAAAAAQVQLRLASGSGPSSPLGFSGFSGGSGGRMLRANTRLGEARSRRVLS